MSHVLDSGLLVSSSLENLGYNAFFDQQRASLAEPVAPARVIAGGRGVLQVLTAGGPRRATVSGRLLHVSEGSALPAVGDWVGLRPDDAEPGVITHVFTRRTYLARKAAGKRAEAQILAANVDVVLIVSSLNADFNPRRLERYLAVALEGGVSPVFVLNKADLCDTPERFVEEVREIAPGAPVVTVSAIAGAGMDAIAGYVRPGETVVLVGSSGVGKSTIANRLIGDGALREGAIRAHDERGKHTTTHRELFVLPGGGLLIDTPGLRELEPWMIEDGGPAGFADVEALAAACRFRDCAHEGEPGCAVAEAVDKGALARGRIEGFRKLAAEAKRLRDRHDARARAEERRRGKEFARILRSTPKR